MTITAVYRQNLVSGGAVTKSGTYFIPWLASGELRIAGGLDVTLIGLDSGSGEFDNLTLTVGKGTKLTLQDVRITGDKTLLSLAGGNTLTLLGENRLTGCTVRVEAEKSVHAMLGSVSITDCGLYASGHSGNSAKTVSQTAGLDAFETVVQQSGVTLLAASGFADIGTESVCQQDVLFCTDAGLMTGTGKDTFSPDTPMTRAMLVTVLWRMAGSPPAQGTGGFTDLKAGWYRQAAVWGAQNGVVAGTGAGTFSPDKPVTKEQAAALLIRFARMQGVTIPAGAAPVYVAKCSAWAQADVQAAYAASILDSFSACLAAPQEAASRVELARMLRLLSDLLQKS